MNLYLKNASIVLEGAVVEDNLYVRDGIFDSAPPAKGEEIETIDCKGDFLLPGLIDIHTDNLEIHVHPRPTVRWPSMLASLIAHDWQILGSGITTVLDALALGGVSSGRSEMLDSAVAALTDARAAGLLKVEHYLHLRCELADLRLPTLIERHIHNPGVKLVSVMDHTPGQRQWSNTALFREYYRKKGTHFWTDDEFEAYLAECCEQQKQLVPSHRTTIRQLCTERGIVMASHDDTTVDDVDESHADGIMISEFPTTVAAARHAREQGMKTVMGSPNVIRGGSHSGNVSAGELADEGLLDMLTSDYVPGSLLHAAFALTAKGFDLSETVAMITKTPADLLGFKDRGRIAAGLRADLLRVRLVDGVPVIRNVWVAGRQFM